jgi:hypothetical protein
VIFHTRYQQIAMMDEANGLFLHEPIEIARLRSRVANGSGAGGSPWPIEVVEGDFGTKRARSLVVGSLARSVLGNALMVINPEWSAMRT